MCMARHASSPAIAIGGDCERNFTACGWPLPTRSGPLKLRFPNDCSLAGSERRQSVLPTASTHPRSLYRTGLLDEAIEAERANRLTGKTATIAHWMVSPRRCHLEPSG